MCILKPKNPFEKGQLKEIILFSHGHFHAAPSFDPALPASVRIERAHAALAHGEERRPGACVVAIVTNAEVVFESSEQVVGFEDEKHLPWDVVQDF